jgi:hypothetical protein
MYKFKLFLFVFFFSFSLSANEPLVLDWIDLIPENERNQYSENGMPILPHDEDNADFFKQNSSANIRPELNKSHVKIPGFVIPLEAEGEKVTEFLLVPYFGACIHVPPPPTNQIIHVIYKKGATYQALWDVVYVTGELVTKTSTHDDIQSSYQLNATKIEPYDEYEEQDGYAQDDEDMIN